MTLAQPALTSGNQAVGTASTLQNATLTNMQAVRDYVGAFLDANLRGKPANPLLNGPSPIYPDAAIITERRPLCGSSTQRR